ncbi:MAG: Calx-beta domain-containing protein, partial [Cyanobacteriota bacterium]|nr:Calx-beta domain-containing protein [Cyanobacteriota bacterium]
EGSVVNLSRATGFQGKDVFRPSFIKAENDGTVKANKLKTIKQVDLYSDNSNLQLPAVNNFTGIDDTVVEATNEGKLTLGAKTINGDVDITAIGKDSVVSLPKLTRFLGKDVFRPSSIITKNGGQVNANKLTTVTNVDPLDIAITSESNITISDTTVTEGNNGRKNAKFTVTLDSESDKTVKVNYATANDTAKAGKDYQKTTGTLTFKPGQTKQTITVPILGDTIDESNEKFNLNLSKPRNAKLGDKRGIGTIRDNDAETADNNNVLTGDKGRDILTGSADSDVFFLTPETKNKAQADRITNFDNTKDFIILGDRLSADEVKLESIKDGTLIKAKKGGKILGIVEDVKPSDLKYSFISGDQPNDIGKFVTFEEPAAKTLGNGNVKLELKGSDGGKFVTTLSEETGIQQVRYVANSTSNFSRSFTFNLNSDGSEIKLKIDGDQNQWKLKRKNNDKIDISFNNEVFMTLPDIPKNDDGSDSPDYDIFDPLDPCKAFKQICETVKQINSVMSWIPALPIFAPLGALQMGLEFTEYTCLLVLGDDEDLANTIASKTLGFLGKKAGNTMLNFHRKQSGIDKFLEKNEFNINPKIFDIFKKQEKQNKEILGQFLGNGLNQSPLNNLTTDLSSSIINYGNSKLPSDGIMKSLRKKLGIDWCDEDSSKKVEVEVYFQPFGNPWAISELYLVSPERKYIGTAPNNISGLNNDAGKKVSLGKFPVGTELKFETDVIVYDDLDKTKQIDKFKLSSTNSSQAKLEQWWDGYGTLGFEDSYSGYFLTDVEFPDDFNDTEVYLSGANFSGNKIIVTE